MSRRRALRRAAPPVRRGRGLARWWTIQRATGLGIVAGLAALLTAGLLGTSGDALLYPYAALLAFTALCGASILWITAFDIRTRGTSGRMRPIRGFDAAVGLALLLPSLYALSLVWPRLG
ncbi:hypothetical protein [Sphingosinicella sp. CPCC 101087]|uniref:hypothetical protein n=1 Tax=Sphingosinicella sp. CPCC 101087 TaxID=2497754 RepID=UPI00101CEC30|nr:hypothetical protein [Sphingosinicella sp. CPCC 101087]